MMYYDRGKVVGRALLFFLYDVEGAILWSFISKYEVRSTSLSTTTTFQTFFNYNSMPT